MAKRKAPKAPKINPNLTGVQATPMALTPQDIRRAANAQVDMATRPTLTALDTQRNQTAVQGAGIQDRLTQMYAGLGQSMEGQLKNYNTSATSQQGNLQAIGQASQDAVARGYQQAQDRITTDAATRGAGLDGGASQALASQAADANARASADATFATTAQQQTQDAYRGLIQSMAATAPMRGAEMASAAGQETAKGLAGIADQRAGVLAQRGPMRAKAITDLTQQAFNNYATVQGLNLKGDAQAIQLALGTANNALGYDRLGESTTHNVTTEGQGAERNQIAWGNLKNSQDRLAWQKSRAAAVDAKGGLAGLTPWQRAQFQKGNDAVRNAIKSVGSTGDAFHQAMVKGADGKMHHYTQAQIKAALLKQFKGDADVVDAGLALAHGTLAKNPDIIARLKARHIGVPKDWTRTAGYTPAQGA